MCATTSACSAHRFDTLRRDGRGEPSACTPDVIFLEPGIDGRDGDDVIPALAAAGFRCPIQLMSGLNAVLTEEARRLGERHGLTMLPVLEKPFRVPAVRQVIEQLGLRRDALASIHVTLADALRHGWLELWYQPKIDLRARVFAGAEGYVRARHPEYGMVPPDSLFSRRHAGGHAGADAACARDRDARLVAVRERRAADPLLDQRADPRARQAAARHRSSAQHRPKASNWPGLVLEISEDEIMQDLLLAQRVERELRPHGISFAIDDFGRAYSAIAQAEGPARSPN